MSHLHAGLEHLSKVNSIPLIELEDAAFTMAAVVWRTTRRVVSDAEILDALRIGIAADAARREQTGEGVPQ